MEHYDLKRVIGRILESFGIAITAGAVLSYRLGTLEYWYLLISGIITILIGVFLQFYKWSFQNKISSTKKKPETLSEEVLREKMDWWKTWLIISVNIVFALVIGALVVNKEYPEAALKLVELGVFFTFIGFISSIKYYCRHDQLLDKLKLEKK